MTKKHHAKHPARGVNVRYQQKIAQGLVDGRLADVKLGDGRPASAKRS